MVRLNTGSGRAEFKEWQDGIPDVASMDQDVEPGCGKAASPITAYLGLTNHQGLTALVLQRITKHWPKIDQNVVQKTQKEPVLLPKNKFSGKLLTYEVFYRQKLRLWTQSNNTSFLTL